MSILMLDPLEVFSNSLEDLLSFAWAKLPNKPFRRVSVALTIIAAATTAICGVTQWDNIIWRIRSAFCRWYPMILRDNSPQASLSTAGSATITEVRQGAIPIGSGECVRQRFIAGMTDMRQTTTLRCFSSTSVVRFYFIAVGITINFMFFIYKLFVFSVINARSLAVFFGIVYSIDPTGLFLAFSTCTIDAKFTAFLSAKIGGGCRELFPASCATLHSSRRLQMRMLSACAAIDRSARPTYCAQGPHIVASEMKIFSCCWKPLTALIAAFKNSGYVNHMKFPLANLSLLEDMSGPLGLGFQTGHESVLAQLRIISQIKEPCHVF